MSQSQLITSRTMHSSIQWIVNPDKYQITMNNEGNHIPSKLNLTADHVNLHYMHCYIYVCNS